MPSPTTFADLELDSVDHQHREADILQAPSHQRVEVIARARDETRG